MTDAIFLSATITQWEAKTSYPICTTRGLDWFA